jgi:chromosome segregation ATPase
MEQWQYWIISLVIAFTGFIVGRMDNAKKEGQQDATLSANVQYIRQSVDNMALEQKDINRKIEKQAEEVTAVKIEQAEVKSSLKSLHKRVDKLDGGSSG